MLEAKAVNALLADRAMQLRLPNPFGHDCQWCADCCARVDILKQLAIRDGANLYPIPDYGDLFRIDKFKEMVDHGVMCNDDGSGCYATATEMSRIDARPSEFRNNLILPNWTHVIWFNK